MPGIYFDFNLATLKPQSKRALEEIAAALAQQPKRAIRIEGHTDNVGTDAYNADLSARRAAAVKTALVSDFQINGRSSKPWATARASRSKAMTRWRVVRATGVSSSPARSLDPDDQARRALAAMLQRESEASASACVAQLFPPRR